MRRAHDRTKTVGASEIGQCSRRIWYVKQTQAHDTTAQCRLSALVQNDSRRVASMLPRRATTSCLTLPATRVFSTNSTRARCWRHRVGVIARDAFGTAPQRLGRHGGHWRMRR